MCYYARNKPTSGGRLTCPLGFASRRALGSTDRHHVQARVMRPRIIATHQRVSHKPVVSPPSQPARNPFATTPFNSCRADRNPRSRVGVQEMMSKSAACCPFFGRIDRSGASEIRQTRFVAASSSMSTVGSGSATLHSLNEIKVTGTWILRLVL